MLAKLILPVFLLAFLPPAQADDSDWRSQVQIADADLSTFSLQLIHQGKLAGSMTYGWEKLGEIYYVRDRTEMVPNVIETAEAVLSVETLLPKSVVIDFAIGRDRMNMDLMWFDGTRQGTSTTLKNGKETVRDMHVREDTLAPLRLAVIGFMAAFPLEEGFETTLPWYNTLANRVETVIICVRDSQRVETPAGEFDTWAVDLKGGSPENIVYITKSLPRKIVRIDVVGQPMHFLRTAS